MLTIKDLLAEHRLLVSPGVYDALSAAIAEQCGARSVYLSGASIAYTRFGQPDLGLVDMSEVAQILSAIRERVHVAIIADGDNGFGNALNVQRTVLAFERAGADAIQLEDQSLPKRCGHLAGKSLIPTAEMVGKIKAACDIRRSNDTLIIARTDAIAVEGFEAALERAEAYGAAGADILFVEALRTVDDMRATVAALGSRAPLLVNLVEGGRTPLLPANELESIGFRIAIFPGSAVRAIAKQLTDVYSTVLGTGTTDSFRGRMLDFNELNRLIGTDEVLARGRAYSAEQTEHESVLSRHTSTRAPV